MNCSTHPETKMTGPYCVDCLIAGLKRENAAMERLLAELQKALAEASPVYQAERILAGKGER